MSETKIIQRALTPRFLCRNKLNVVLFALLFFHISVGKATETDTAIDPVKRLAFETKPTSIHVDATTNHTYNLSKIKRSLRLPNTTFPLHYHLHIVTHIHREIFEFTGNVTMDIEIRESTNEIVLHAKNITVRAITMLELHTHETLDDLSYTYEEYGSYLIIHPIENYIAFEAGQHYRLEILYKGLLNEDTFGIYWMTYSDEKNGTV